MCEKGGCVCMILAWAKTSSFVGAARETALVVLAVFQAGASPYDTLLARRRD